MTLVNRMDDPVVPTSPDAINFLDPEIQECPYPAYSLLRDQAPVWRDPITGMYNITRYDDLRKVLLDTDNFPSERPVVQGQFDGGRAKKIVCYSITAHLLAKAAFHVLKTGKPYSEETLFRHQPKP